MMSKWLASSLNLGLVPERLLVKSQSAYSCAGSSMVERQVVALVMKGFDSHTIQWLGGGIGRHNRLKSGTTDGFESLPGHQAEVAQR